jgi:uncharacterized membrane protein YjjB (DUF3815 family)
MLAQLMTSFLASSGFGILFNAPKNALIKCGLVGMCGWMIYFFIVEKGIDSVPASFAASFAVAIISQFFARKYKTPMIIFIVGGIIPLVPGGLAYDAMRNFVANDYNTAINLSAKVVLIAGAIALGIVFSEVFNQIYRNVRLQIRKKVVKT